jgi:hypothetical protein
MRDNYNKLRQKFITSFIIASSLLIFASCGPEAYTQEDTSKQKGEQSLYFTQNENGNKVHYEVNFDDGEISSIYKDGVKIPDNEIKDYEDLINDELNSIKDNKHDFFILPSPHVFHFDMDSMNEKMKEMRKKLKAENFHFKFDHKKFKEDMKKMREELKNLDNIVIHIDKDKICENLDKSLMHLNNLNFDFDFDFDADKHEISMENLEEEMENLKEEMSDLSIEMKDLNKEMKTLSKFLEAVKSELVKDELINSTDEDFDLELKSTGMKVNGEKVSENLFEKYKKMYEDHFNKELKDGVKFRVK